MIKEKSSLITDDLIKKVVDENLLRHTIQLFRKTEEGFKPFGSGVLVLIVDTHFILTASHVADFLFQAENHLFIRVEKNKFIKVIGDIKLTDMDKSKGIDLAYIRMDRQMLPAMARPYKFVTIDRITDHKKTLDASNYCIVGFPENNIRRTSGFLETGAAFYVTNASNDKPYEFYKFSKEDHIILDMKGKATNLLSGDKTKVNTHFYGISGGGLWLLLFNQDPETKEYWIDYRLIGIMTEFKKGKYFCLIANKIHLIMTAFRIIEGLKIGEKKVSR